MEALLKAVAEEMLDSEVPFVQTEDEKRCRNCDFKGICGR
jgi:CRISPR/Cas system-associated exonuclease Cas4 (RecB family)